MTKTDKLSFGIGMVVAGLLTWRTYYTNSHPGTAKISELVYVVLFLPSVGFMATENASRLEQIFVVIFVVLTNGALYWLVVCLFRKLIALAEKP